MLMFVIVLLLSIPLVVSFGIGWPLVRWAESKVAKWEGATGWRRVGYGIGIAICAVAGVVAAIDDVYVNYSWASALFREFPQLGRGKRFLTQRIQSYLPRFHEFKRGQQLYMIVVVRIANFIDRTPHFEIPPGLKLK